MRADGESPEPLWDLTNWGRHRSGDYSKHAKAYNDFAEGGHVQADRDLAKRAEEAAAEARRKKQEMDHFDALFGGPSNPVPKHNTKGQKLVRTETDNQGATRTRYQETYTLSQPVPKAPKNEKEEMDLLDL